MLKEEKMLSEIFDQPKAVAYWTKIFDMMYANNGPNTWDYQWLYTRLKNNSLTIVPIVNLIENIGFGPGATHAMDVDSRFMPPAKVMEFPIRHPPSFIPLKGADRRLQYLFGASLISRIVGKARHLAR